MIKKKHIPVDELKQLFKEIKSFLPEWLLSPLSFIRITMIVSNNILMIICYLMLLGQSARLLSKNQAYADVKVLLFKWILMISFQLLFGQISLDNIESFCIKFMFLMIIFAIIYPSKVSRQILKHYLNANDNEIKATQQVSIRQSVILARNSLLQKVLESFTVSLLKITKSMIKFIHPVNRKSIDQEINLIIKLNLEEKKFHQNIQKAKTKQESPITELQPLKQNLQQNQQKNQQKQIIKTNIQKVKNQAFFPKIKDLGDSTYEMRDSAEIMKQSLSGTKKQSITKIKDSTTPIRNQTIKQQKASKRSRKYIVSQYLLLFNTSNRITFSPNTPSTKRCAYYREIEICYDVDSSVMSVTSLEDMKVAYHNLQEIVLLDDLMAQFQFQDNQIMIVKFNSKLQFQQFIAAIDAYEEGAQK